MSDTKYGDLLEDHEWSEREPGSEPERTRIRRHTVDVIYVTDPGETGGYGREKYTAHIHYDEDAGSHVSHVVEHRWKGNYWRDTTDWDFEDVPEPVRQRVASVLAVRSATSLDTDIRVIDEGGESRFQKYHKPRMDAMDGAEMWATSSLREAVRSVEAAAEQLDGTDTGDRAEGLIDDLQGLLADLDPDVEEVADDG